jgi:hypothetical protein
MKAAFEQLKGCFTTGPVLTHCEPKRQCIIETDASDFTLGVVLSQRDSQGKLHLIAFHSQKFTPAEINFEIHDKELVAIVASFKIWRRYLECALEMVILYTDHHNLEYSMSTKVLNRRQARWAQELAGINFKIIYQPGSQKRKAGCSFKVSRVSPYEGGVRRPAT